MPAHCPGTALSDGRHCRGPEAQLGGRVGRNWPVLPSKPDFQEKTSALMVLERHEGSFVCVSGSKGDRSCTATIDCKLGNHRIRQS